MKLMMSKEEMKKAFCKAIDESKKIVKYEISTFGENKKYTRVEIVVETTEFEKFKVEE